MPRESRDERARRAARIAQVLAKTYPDVRTALRFANPFELLIATILSAQCTDKKVNEVTAVLFRRFGTPAKLAAADPAAVEEIIRPTGFYRQKAKSIQSASRDLVESFGGEVPRTLEELVKLRGVARKTASVVLGNAFGIPAIAVDTHMLRVNRRLGLTAHEEPDLVERDLAEILPPREWIAWTNRIIHHGRVCCVARAPRCPECPLLPLCPEGVRRT
ncbi:MAG: endonuclease III [Proteobacteria bacterium]|nr:MAG: endonuclease III [Pseudomonadota bacterium]